MTIDKSWNFDMESVPKYALKTEIRKIKGKEKEFEIKKSVNIWATDGEMVTKSKFMFNEDAPRWEGFTKDKPPIAWQHFLIPNPPKGNNND